MKSIFGILLFILVFILLTALSFNSICRFRSKILTHKAYIENRRGNYQSGLNFAKQAIALDKWNGYAYYYAGLNEISANKPSDALTYLYEANGIMPHLPSLYRLLGQTEYTVGKNDLACKHYQDYLTMEPIPVSSPGKAYFIYGQSLYRNGQYGEAAYMLQEAEKYDDFSTRTLSSRLLSAIVLNEPRFAQYLFRRYLLKTHADKVTSSDIFTANMALLKPESFLEFANSVKVNISDNFGAIQAIALAHAKLGNEKEARENIARLFKLDEQNPDVYLTEADVCTLLGDTLGAQNAYQQYLDKCPNSSLRSQILTNLQNIRR